MNAFKHDSMIYFNYLIKKSLKPSAMYTNHSNLIQIEVILRKLLLFKNPGVTSAVLQTCVLLLGSLAVVFHLSSSLPQSFSPGLLPAEVVQRSAWDRHACLPWCSAASGKRISAFHLINSFQQTCLANGHFWNLLAVSSRSWVVGT